MDKYKQAAEYILELVKWSEKTSLLSLKDRGLIFSRHFLDALFLAGKIPAGPGMVMDLGSGNGMPSVPVAIFRKELKIFCFESRLKKAAFLSNIKNKLSLENMVIINDRIESVADKFPSFFDFITARAFSEIGEIIHIAKPFAKKAAILFVFNALAGREQNKKPKKDINIVDNYVYKLPDGIERALLSFKLL